jgi:hypothetical protein
MKRIKGWLTVVTFFGLVLVNVAIGQAGHVPNDTRIHLAINGTEVASVDTNGQATGSMPINGNFSLPGGGPTITIASYTTGGTPRIEWNEPEERLWLRDVKITSSAPITDMSFKFWRKFTTSRNGPFTYEARGGGFLKRGGGGAVGAEIDYRGSVETPPGQTNVIIGGLALPPIICPPQPGEANLVKCVTQALPAPHFTFSWSSFYNSQSVALPTGNHRILTGEFWLTLPTANTDSLQLSNFSTGGLWVKGVPTGGPPRNACDDCSGEDCLTCLCTNCGTTCQGDCVSKANLSWLCSTTYTTAQAFGCPSCVTEDGMPRQSAKASLFVQAHWEDLHQEVAQGRGEHLASLASLLNVPQDQEQEFNTIYQEEYRGQLLRQQPMSSEAFVMRLRIRLSERQEIARLEILPVN